MEELLQNVTKYLILAYFSETAATISKRLLPTKLRQLDEMNVKDFQEWVSTAFGVALTLSTDQNIFVDFGLSMKWPMLGLVFTGLVVGQGGRYLQRWMNQFPMAGGPKKNG